MNTEVKNPLIHFLEFCLHLHKLNYIFVNSISRYEKQVEAYTNAERLIKKYAPEKVTGQSESNIEIQKEFIATVQKEISENYYTLKSSEIILIYSRLESAISETIHLIFKHTDIRKLKEIENIKINAIAYLQMNKRDRYTFLADQYIIQTTQSIRYGFARFEAILKPIIGESNLTKQNRDYLFKFAQIRNLLVHKNGIVDKSFKHLFKSNKYKLNRRIDIDAKLLNRISKSTLAYVDNVLDRIEIQIKNTTK